jgi:flagellar biogenesis protein FliO
MVVCVVGALAALQSATSPTAALSTTSAIEPVTAPVIAPGIDPSFAPSSAYGELLVSSLAVVAVICVLAFVVVRLWGRGGLGLGGARRKRGGLLEVIARQPLEPRRSLYVVRAGTRTLLVGTSELGVTLLTELEGVDGVSDGMGDGVGDAAVSDAGFGELVRRATQRFAARRSERATEPRARGAGEGPA